MLFFRNFTAISVITLAGFALGTACSSDEGATEGSGASTGSGAASSGGTDSSSGGTVNTNAGAFGNGDAGETSSSAGQGNLPVITDDGTALCGDVVCQCADGEDNDGDGDSDGFDVECQGPLDNDEGSFATGIPGDNRDGSWMDCFFDGDSGAGNDGCKYAPECLTGGLDPNSEDCAISQTCLDYCGARTPNGCDCFGCCTIQFDSGDTIDILTTTGCDFDNIEDEDACPRCTKTSQCENTCGECELCPGKTVEDLPEECEQDPPAGGSTGDPPPDYTCEGAEVCAENIPCETGYYCSLGCCMPVVR
jgi:hypothetical protein